MTLIPSTNSVQTSLHLGNNEVAKGRGDNSTNITIKPSHNQQTSAKSMSDDRVSISAEAAEKQLKDKKSENLDASDNAKNKSVMELAEEIKQKTIDDIKNRLKELTEQLHKLDGQRDEKSQEQAKLLQGQITDLNAQLLTIMSA